MALSPHTWNSDATATPPAASASSMARKREAPSFRACVSTRWRSAWIDITSRNVGVVRFLATSELEQIAPAWHVALGSVQGPSPLYSAAALLQRLASHLLHCHIAVARGGPKVFASVARTGATPDAAVVRAPGLVGTGFRSSTACESDAGHTGPMLAHR